MKSCSKCQRTYPDDAGFCAQDGTRLVFTSMLPVAPDAADPRIGKRLCGRYEIRRVVADGGMGRVYEGVDKQTNSRLALKVLHDDVAKDEVSLERFKREYEISAKLPHNHIVQVLDFQHDPQMRVWMLAMEFLDGEELRIVLKREKLIPPERVVRMLSQVALGLDEAHSRQFVHRDLKPDNLFLCGTREGDIVKILDFGSVKDKNKDAKKLTVMGTTIGSPYYMAPEQAQGLETLDARADVFALAAIAYECLTGSVPFQGSNGPSILLAILTKEPVPPTVAGKDAPVPIPPALDAVMEVALAKNPNIRTKTVGELAEAIGHAYGLAGDHRAWAVTPIATLAQEVLAARPAVMAVKPAGAVADPFAVPDPFGAPQQPAYGAAPGQPAQPQWSPPAQAYDGQGLDRAFEVARRAEYEAAAGVPKSGGLPVWLLPVIVAAVALFVGGGLVVLFVLLG